MYISGHSRAVRCRRDPGRRVGAELPAADETRRETLPLVLARAPAACRSSAMEKRAHAGNGLRADEQSKIMSDGRGDRAACLHTSAERRFMGHA